jgi:serine/threonine-protein kinase
MGEVYRARDPRLGRDVAIKVLPGSVANDPDRLRRFEQEARAVAALSHPNVLAIFDVGRDGDISFLVTELLEGEPLSARLLGGPVPVKQAIDVMLQISAGLAAAHARGIVHRDVKPDNVFLTRDGFVKILDFGLAKFDARFGGEDAETRIGSTSPGTVLGTVGYMAPEQVRGREADARSDVFSLGAIFHELVSGRRAFDGPSPADTLSAILVGGPTEVTLSASGVSPALSRVVSRCLEKEPEERYQSMRDLRFAIEALSDPLSGSSASGAPAAAVRNHAAPSIAVLPFTDMSPQKDQDYFCEGMAEEIINALAKIDGLKVAARTSTFQFKTRGHDLKETARALQVKTVLEGSVRTAGNRLRVTAQLVDAADGRAIWSDRYDGETADVFDIQDRISSAIVAALKIRLLGDQPVEGPARYTRNIDAYHAYLKGRHHRFTTYNLLEALRAFKEAVALDPSYAPAHAAVGYTLVVLGNYGYLPPQVAQSQALAAIDRAMELDDQLALTQTARGYLLFFEHRWAKAEQHFKRAIELDPNDIEAHVFYGLQLTVQGRTAEAIRQVERASEIEPFSPWTRSAAGLSLWIIGDMAGALRECDRALEIRPDSLLAMNVRGSACSGLGRHDEGIAMLEAALAMGQGATWVMCVLGAAYGQAGRIGDAERLLRTLDERQLTAYVSPGLRAMIPANIGRHDEALGLLELEVRTGGALTTFFRTPLFKPLHGQARFSEILRSVDLPGV